MPLTAVRARSPTTPPDSTGWWARAADLGWTSLLVAEADGGGSLGGEGVLDLVIVAEEMGVLVSTGPGAHERGRGCGQPSVARRPPVAVLPDHRRRCRGRVVRSRPRRWVDGTGGGVTARRTAPSSCSTVSRRPWRRPCGRTSCSSPRAPTAGSPSSWCPRGPPGWRSHPSAPSTSSVATPPCASTASECPTRAWSATSTAPTPRSSVSCSSPSSCSARRRSARVDRVVEFTLELPRRPLLVRTTAGVVPGAQAPLRRHEDVVRGLPRRHRAGGAGACRTTIPTPPSS